MSPQMSLRQFPPLATGKGGASSLDALPVESSVDVFPEGGTLVLLRSPLVPHEVITTHRQRQCVVAWFRTMRSRR